MPDAHNWAKDGRTFGEALLANMCAVRGEQDLRYFEIDLHCAYVYVVARVTSAGLPVTFDIIYYELVNWKDRNAHVRATEFFDSQIREQV